MLHEVLTPALDARIQIEQAKGVVSESCGVDIDEASALLLRYSRAHQRDLADVVREVVGGALLGSAFDAA